MLTILNQKLTVKRENHIGKNKASWAELDTAVATMPEGQRKIFEAAVDEFAVHGFAGSSTLAIAERAGVSEGLIFKYFKNKATLLKQVVFPVLATAIMPLAIRGVKSVTDAEHETFGEFLTALIRERLDFARRHKKHLRIMLQELPLNEELRSRMVKGLKAELLPIISEKISHYQKQGTLRQMSVEQLLSYLVPQIIGFVLSRAVFAFEFATNEEKDIQTLIEVMLHGVAAPEQAVRGKK